MDITVALEVVLARAARDGDFREQLFRYRADGAWLERLGLGSTEAAMMKALPRETLEASLEGVAKQRMERRTFLGAVSALGASVIVPRSVYADDEPDVSGAAEAPKDKSPAKKPLVMPAKKVNSDYGKQVSKGIAPKKTLAALVEVEMETEGVAAEAYEAALQKKRSWFKGCAIKHGFVTKDKSKCGVRVELVLPPGGAPVEIGNPKAYGPGSKGGVIKCITQRIKTIEFPEHDAEVACKVTITFEWV